MAVCISVYVPHGVVANFFEVACEVFTIRGVLYSGGTNGSRKMRTDDGCIVQECLNGKPEAFGILVDKYKAGIYAYVCAEVRNFQDAEDVTQEVFLKAYHNLRSLRRWESFGFWLYRIARNQCKKWVRSQSRRPDSSLIEDQDPRVVEKPSLDAYRVGQVDESLREALDSLSEIYREVLLLHYFGGMTIRNIARAIGVSPSAIGMRLNRARAQLKEEMIAMMDTAFEGHKLQASFTFHIVEAVKRIKINPMPRMTGLPWGLSLAAGIAVVVMTLGSQMSIYKQPTPLAFPSETETLKVREVAVDILSGPQTSVMTGKQGDIDSVGMDQRSPENTSLLAPAKGGGTWTQKADMPTARFIAGSAVVDGKVYVIGGAPVSKGMTAVVEEYDPATDTWTRRTDMPTARQGVCAAAVDGIIYAIGGYAADRIRSTVEAYDLATDMWTTKVDMPTARTQSAIAVVDGIIYVIGGCNQPPNYPGLSTVEAYDPPTNTWTKKADMPTARFIAGSVVVDGKIYVSGGVTKQGGPGAWGCVPTVEVYDPATDTWTQASDMPWPRFGHTASVVAGKMYIISGAPGEARVNIEVSKTVDVYDPATDTWTTAADFPTAGGNRTADVVDGKIYTIGGNPIHGPFPLSTVYKFDPGLPDNISVTSPAGKLLGTWGNVRAAE
jgi:RNA polymerase sigma factor (sigma-70 family)